MVRATILFVISVFGAAPATACDLALVLALDVSGSVDGREFQLQRDGLADGLRDAVVSEALVAAQARVTVLQWTGSGRQQVTIPWTVLSDFEALDRLADRVSADTRVWRNYSTAIGEALAAAVAEFRAVPDCARRVIDVSGDGRSNEGFVPSLVRPQLLSERVTVNALVIEGAEDDLTGYFWENVIFGEGAFVVTANSFDDYPDRIRLKLRRETTKQTAHMEE